jgi:hypothetical protein
MIERLLPHAFVGEKVAKPDEGALDSRKNSIRANCTAPLIRLRHLLPSQKPRGEKALDVCDWRECSD